MAAFRTDRGRRCGRTLAAGLALLVLAAACTARLQPMGEPVRPPGLEERALVAPDGYRLPVQVWRSNPRPQPKAVVLALHGFNDYSNAFAPLGPFLARRGYTVYALDQRGFGATQDPGIWPGTATLVADLEAAGRALAARHPGVPLVLVGESMGGAVVLSALAGRHRSSWLREATSRTILVAPAVWGWSTMNPLYQAALVVGFATLPGLVLHAPRDLDVHPTDNIDALRAMSRDPLVIKGARVDAIYGLVDLMEEAYRAAPALPVPALVLYGGQEDIIPEGPRDQFVAALPEGHARVVVYPNGYHMLLRDLQAEVVLNDIAAWLEAPAAPLPSGLGDDPPPSG